MIKILKNIILLNKVRKLKKIHIEIEEEYIKYINKFIPKEDFIYKNLDIAENVYIQKNFFSILMLLILDFNKIENLKKHGLIIHAIRNTITNTDNIIDLDNKGNLDVKKLENPILKNVMSLLIANEILNKELLTFCEVNKISRIKEKFLRSIYEIAKGEEIREIKKGRYMSYDEVIEKIHSKIGGELLAISMIVPVEIYENEKLKEFQNALFEIGLSLQLLDDIVDIKEDYEAGTQNAFFSYLLDKNISIREIENYILKDKKIEKIEGCYNELIAKAIKKGIDGFKYFGKNGFDLGVDEAYSLMKFMFKNRGMENEWKIFEEKKY